MEENRRNDEMNENRSSDDDQLRGNTMNETIREASGNPDMDLNNVSDAGMDTGRSSDYATEGVDDINDTTRRGMNWTPQDASGVRSGGKTDMDDQTESGAGANTPIRRGGTGSGLAPKMGTTGSDYDGQNSTS